MVSQEQIKELMNNIAHQWRQPLSQINSAVGAIDNILYDKNIKDQLLEEKLQEIEMITKNMSNIIDDFKNYFDSDGLKEVFSLKDLLHEASDTLHISLKENEILLEKVLDSEGVYESFKGELKQVILVLLNNAKDALLERNIYNAKITLSLVEQKSKYLIKVCDNAGGITKSVREKMFEVNYSTKHKSLGSGRGLHMVRQIIEEKFEGSLSVKNVEEGSCFTISLPKRKKNA